MTFFSRPRSFSLSPAVSSVMTIGNMTALPSYSPPPPLPDYTCELSCGERLLEQTPRSLATSRSTPTGVFIKKAGDTTVVLNDQQEGVSIPKYGRRGLISGTVILDQCESIVEVTLRIKGKVEVTISDATGHSTRTVDDRHTLWSQSSSSPASQKSRCPSQFAFSVILPTTYKSENAALEPIPLPPSYDVSYYGLPSLFFRSTYSIHIAIDRARHPKLDSLWTKTKQHVPQSCVSVFLEALTDCFLSIDRITIPFNYWPRIRAHRSISVSGTCFLDSIKTTPEEWYQAPVATLQTRPNVHIEPIYVQLFVPAAKVYGLKDMIPFHVQLSGNVSSLSCLVDHLSSANSHCHPNNTSKIPVSDIHDKPFLKVSLIRQISVTLKLAKAWKDDVIGEGTIRAIPPSHGLNAGACITADRPGECHLDWEGELRVSEGVVVGGFDTGNTSVRDFIVLMLSPPSPRSPMLPLQISVPIRLVTDSCDVSGLDLHT